MIRPPASTWLYTGSWPFSVIGIFPEDIERAYAHEEFKFDGPGWYPSHRFLVEETGEERDGRPTYQVLRYDVDPRETFAAAAMLPTKGDAADERVHVVIDGKLGDLVAPVLNAVMLGVGHRLGKLTAEARDARPCPKCGAAIGAWCTSDTPNVKMIHRERFSE